MSKSYRLGKKSDLRRMERDLEARIMQNFNEEFNSKRYDITCPGCKNIVSAKPGTSFCPFCGEEIDLTLDIHS